MRLAQHAFWTTSTGAPVIPDRGEDRLTDQKPASRATLSGYSIWATCPASGSSTSRTCGNVRPARAAIRGLTSRS